MNVLLIATYSGISGASKSLVKLAELLKSKGVNIIVIIPKNGEIEKLLVESEISYKVIRLYNWVAPLDNKIRFNGNLAWKVKQVINYMQEIRLFYLIKQNNIDIVHINAITANWGYLASRIARVKTVWHIRELLEEDLNKQFRDKKKSVKQISQANKIIAISNSVSLKYKDILKVDISTIYNGIDSANFVVNNKSLLKDNYVKCTIAGRLIKEKGILECIEALNILISHKGYKNISLDIIGVGDKEYTALLKKKISEYDLEKNVKLLGFKSNIHNYFVESDIIIVSSKAEAFGRVTIEAMLSQSLVIGANTQGTEELIGRDYGLLYNQGSSSDLAKKIEYAVNNKQFVREKAFAGREYALNFSAEKNASEIFKLYNEIL
ncbi:MULTISPECIES: glycosyltransferase family 4 protein [Bacillaceae]|uniref:Glycosyltransferase involved in cell wall biosynthesis n=1 Tax=Alkalicoccobacillus plakortidis TaxID=444060 RepID=A0A9D5DP01_9BACI|nr:MULTISPECIES: glycosyltransferase family 4 protein [Bacillaceae]KQL56488.1 hypothetical protein AN965_13600 [Alkalicoccobacillus plakortidis]